MRQGAGLSRMCYSKADKEDLRDMYRTCVYQECVEQADKGTLWAAVQHDALKALPSLRRTRNPTPPSPPLTDLNNAVKPPGAALDGSFARTSSFPR